ncbi:LysM peptidoglycan-binding domain-containing protein [Nesterenkonia flava]|uniref:LysM peptidoglycan-binding domain-containing protein n=1 Tax=Nesterenkonia flava TaxID=469799 RepID=A0ABU1FRW3_9MICC|nr:LysM peptidoglycan-binding domain-containing protein [Nesterenkonia flava]MDR5711399.1 LysM peptidoglycan-binding domain-containing protein [Nesterenkonia flava]
MPTARILAGRQSHRSVTVTAKGGATRPMRIVPNTWTFDGNAHISELDRPGMKPVTRRSSDDLLRLQFEQTMAHPSPYASVQGDVNWFRDKAVHAIPVRFSNMPRQWWGWWLIEDLRIDVHRMNPDNSRISRATLHWRCVEYQETTAKIVKSPPPPKPRGANAKQSTYRWHTVVQGDWLSKIAQRYYGNAMEWPRIYRANKAEIDKRGNPDRIFPGQRFRIPPK